MEIIDAMYVELNGTMTYAEVTDIVMGVIFYDVWNGELPQVLTSDSLSALIGSPLNP